MAFVVFDAGILRHSPLVEVAIGGDDEVEFDIFNRRSSNIQDIQVPFGLVRIPVRRVDFGAEATFRMDIVFLGQRLPVVLDLVALSVLLGPVDFG